MKFTMGLRTKQPQPFLFCSEATVTWLTNGSGELMTRCFQYFQVNLCYTRQFLDTKSWCPLERHAFAMGILNCCLSVLWFRAAVIGLELRAADQLMLRTLYHQCFGSENRLTIEGLMCREQELQQKQQLGVILLSADAKLLLSTNWISVKNSTFWLCSLCLSGRSFSSVLCGVCESLRYTCQVLLQLQLPPQRFDKCVYTQNQSGFLKALAPHFSLSIILITFYNTNHTTGYINLGIH